MNRIFNYIQLHNKENKENKIFTILLHIFFFIIRVGITTECDEVLS